MPHDHHHLQYCKWLSREHGRNPRFLGHILWSDEIAFPRKGVFNSHNSHFWAHHNPHVTRECGHQVRLSINVWTGIIGNCVVGPFLLPESLSGPAYCVFLQEVQPLLLEDVPLAVRRDMWFQHDGAPVHFSAQTQHTVF
jgi:hypothetical protein